MDRLLTDKQITQIEDELDPISALLYQPYREVSEVKNRIRKAQDAKTRKLTLKEVGEWLDNLMTTAVFPNLEAKSSVILNRSIEALKRGEMPQ